MIATGRIASAIGLLTICAVMMMTMSEGLRNQVNASQTALVAVNAAAGLSAFLLLSSWAIGIYHWGKYYGGKWKGTWGMAVIFGGFVGTTVYWWFATRARQVASAD